METLILIMSILALGASVIGWLWIIGTAFSNDDTLMGVLGFLLFPVAVVYGILNFGELKVPLLLLTGGLIVRVLLAILVAAFL